MFMRLTITAASVLLITGCASLINDKDQKINVTTSNGTTIQGTVNGQPFTAPGVVSVTRENKGKVFATNNPNCAKETAVEKTVDPIFFINVIVTLAALGLGPMALAAAKPAPAVPTRRP